MRGRFLRADGFVLPNNISLIGAKTILAAALRNTVPTFWAALVVGQPSSDMSLADMSEPTIGFHGYSRIAIPRNAGGWPQEGEVGGEAFLGTNWLTWVPTGGVFDKPIQRVALVAAATGPVPVLALSAPLPTEVTLAPDTLLSQRQFQYQLYI